MARKARVEKTPAAATNGPSNELSLKTMREVAALRILLDEANGAYRARLKKAKSDGEDTKELIRALADRKVDPDAIHVSMRAYARYRALLGMPLVQTEIFAADVSLSKDAREEQAVWDVETAGYEAGKGGAGKDDNRHPAGSAQHQAWARGWLRGQAMIAKQLGANAKRASTRRSRDAQPSLLPGADADKDNGAGEQQTAARKRGAGRKAAPTPKARRAADKAAAALAGSTTVN